MDSIILKEQFVTIITQIKEECNENYTQQFYADIFGVSRKKINELLNYKSHDIDLLSQYCAFHDKKLSISIRSITPFEHMIENNSH